MTTPHSSAQCKHELKLQQQTALMIDYELKLQQLTALMIGAVQHLAKCWL
jgi:hypothetical protein